MYQIIGTKQSQWGTLFETLATNVADAPPVRPKTLNQDQLLGLFDGGETGAGFTLVPATDADMRGKFSKPKIFIDSKIMLVGLTDFNEEKIYLYKDNGELVKGFPIKGSSVIDIKDSDNDGKIEIISRLDNFSIVSYEINLTQN